MDAPNDVCALFHSAFHPTQGNIVDFALKVRDDINLDGVEFSSLPSGLHLVDQDVIHFTKGGLCGVAVFRRRRIRENGLRGVRLGAVGILINSSPRARPWLHLPHLKRLAAHLEETPEAWDPLKEYFESHRLPDLGPDIQELWSGWEYELATASPNHPLHHLPCLLHAFGPSIMTLFRYVLARRRVLIYTRVPTSASRTSFNSLSSRPSEDNSVVDQTVEAGAAPVVEPACVLARVVSDICFGWRNENDGAVPEVLGMVGLDAIEQLGEESMKQSGWIACTTERIFFEKPHLYDLVVDLSPSLLAHAPTSNVGDDKPVLSASSSSKLTPTRPTYSDTKVYNDIERALYAQTGHSSTTSLSCACPAEHEDDGWVVWDRWGQGCLSPSHGVGGNNRHSCAAGMNIGPCSSGLNGHGGGTSESTTNSRSWADPWRIYDEVCIFCAGVCSWLGLGTRSPARDLGVRLSGPDETLRAQPSPNSDLRAQRRAHVLELMTLFHKYAAFLHARLGDIIDTYDGRAQQHTKRKSSNGALVLTSKDMIALELSPLSVQDAQFLEAFGSSVLAHRGSERRVVVRRTWKDMVVAVVGTW